MSQIISLGWYGNMEDMTQFFIMLWAMYLFLFCITLCVGTHVLRYLFWSCLFLEFTMTSLFLSEIVLERILEHSLLLVIYITMINQFLYILV